MIKRAGLTRIDLVVALSCLVFILINVQVITAGGRERSKREVCMANLRALTAAWQMYADDNKGKIPPGDVYYSWSFPTSAGGPQLAWREWPHHWPHSMPPTQATNQAGAFPFGSMITEADWQHATSEGLLWKYVKDYRIYQCPDGDKNTFATYSMSQSMNTYPNAAGTTAQPAPTITNRNQITKPAERFVFLDTGYVKRGAFFVKYSGTNIARWYDSPPMRHNKGTIFSFADGHVIYKKWTEPHTLDSLVCAWGMCSDDNCDCDLRWMVKATWGKILYDCTNPAKNCED